MNDENSTQNNSTNEHDIIYFTNTEETINRFKKDDEETSLKKIEPTKYITPVIIAIFIYSLCVWATKTGFTEIIDIEIPLIILLTLILTESVIQGYGKFLYPIYIIASCLAFYFIKDTYALFIIISFTAVVTCRCLEKIYYNKNDYPNISNDEFKIYSVFSRVKYHILLSFMIFTIFLLLGYYYPGTFQPLVMPSVENLHNGVKEGTISLDTISLFMNNYSVALNMILSGFYFSTFTLYSLAFNALYIGFSGAITNIKYFLSFTIPHGILELTAIILSGAAGLRITHAILVLLHGIKLNEDNKKEIFTDASTKFIKMFLDVVILLIIITIMLFIAAYIEANLTISIGTQLYNF